MCERGKSKKDNREIQATPNSAFLGQFTLKIIFWQAAPRTPLLRADWLAPGASRLSNMAAPSGGVNCEEFAEFQVMGFSSCGWPDPSFCSHFWSGREREHVVEEGGSLRFFPTPSYWRSWGRGLGLRKQGCRRRWRGGRGRRITVGPVLTARPWEASPGYLEGFCGAKPCQHSLGRELKLFSSLLIFLYA